MQDNASLHYSAVVVAKLGFQLVDTTFFTRFGFPGPLSVHQYDEMANEEEISFN